MVMDFYLLTYTFQVLFFELHAPGAPFQIAFDLPLSVNISVPIIGEILLFEFV